MSVVLYYACEAAGCLEDRWSHKSRPAADMDLVADGWSQTTVGWWCPAHQTVREQRVVRVRWIDAFDTHQAEWCTISDADVGMVCESVGFVVFENADYIVVSHSLSADGECRGGFGIPRVAIQQLIEIGDQ